MAKSLVSLKTEADQLGLQYPEDIKASELDKLVEAAYEAAETVDVAAEAAVTLKNTSTVGKMTIGQKAKAAEAAARKTRIVMVFDNDTRENSETTVAVVNCGNQYFDLGTAYIPLGEKVEVMQGHIDVLKEVDMPHHMRVGDSSRTILRKRYTVSYED
jgi:hypothetical protein